MDGRSVQEYVGRNYSGAAMRFLVVLPLALGVARPSVSPEYGPNRRVVTFEERVTAQRAIEGVLWNHRVWPEQNPRPKPSLEQAFSEEALRSKVRKYLRESSLLAREWDRPVTAHQLQSELDRISRNTKAPKVTAELYGALNNDANLIAETLARQVL